MSRERLVNLLMEAETDADIAGFSNCFVCRPKADFVADYLLANGVVVPPCKVGDKLYIVTSVSKEIVECKIIGMWILDSVVSVITDLGTVCNESFGKTVFLSREEAEAKLSEKKEYAPFIGSKEDREGH